MLTFTLPDMTCGHCVSKINRVLKDLDPGCVLEFDLAVNSIRVESTVSRDELVETLAEAGYKPA